VRSSNSLICSALRCLNRPASPIEQAPDCKHV
jgi:hypothetical protein